MGKVKYKQLSAKFDNIVPSTGSSDFRKNLVRGNNITEVFQINTDKILSFDKQARKIFDEKELEKLASSIKEVGITSPLLVMKSQEQGKFHVINGERRLRAAKMLNLEKVPCIITDKEEKSELIAIIDNIQRADLHPIELAEAYQSLIRNYGDKKNIAEKIGVAYSSFVEILKLNELPSEIRNYLLNNDIRSRLIFRKLLKLTDIEKMKEILGLIKRQGIISRRRSLLDISIKNGKIEFNFHKYKLSVSNRDTLLTKLHELISQIQKQEI